MPKKTSGTVTVQGVWRLAWKRLPRLGEKCAFLLDVIFNDFKQGFADLTHIIPASSVSPLCRNESDKVQMHVDTFSSRTEQPRTKDPVEGSRRHWWSQYLGDWGKSLSSHAWGNSLHLAYVTKSFSFPLECKVFRCMMLYSMKPDILGTSSLWNRNPT